MMARNALLGVLLSGFILPALAASPIPVVESGNSGSSAGTPAPVTVTPVHAGVNAPVSQPGILLNQLETLQNEVMEMRGMLEEQANLIDRIQKENRDRYLDLDRRISQLASGGTSGSQVTPPVQPADSAGSAGSFAPAVTPVAPVADKTGEKLYQNTFQLIRDRKFKESVAGLNEYLQKYPRGPYADNAQYWLGEVHLAQGEVKEAEVAFSNLVKTYPMSDKLPDATYKLGQVYDRLGERTKSREYLQMVIDNFPGSSAARLADVYLRNLES
ncbi:tol-pal system protein YbgF [Sansalvadorimonas sp. 2012CJ34-2]|uniref:Cell division coordinator CpoB n=1 Tax=Parendozoicomonas callyspongiae TaxID=2942213 RepID=A0ABT0PG63_9GAMM|nr:tol-pal system protein YbgF [Sansalvadorimonas sp. 2012CJ34-2]MCL6270246.1 tol-pal system protein YbgF [Sansalvadorimonas sp. 2012CJ34-2]